MLKNFKIRTKIIVSFILTMIIGISVGSYISYKNTNEILTRKTNDYLDVEAQSRVHHIDTILHTYIVNAEVFATIPDFKRLLDSPENFEQAYKKAKEGLETVFKPELNIDRLRILDKDGKVVLSSLENDTVGTIAVFEKAKEKTYIEDVHISKKTGVPSMSISSPIFNNGEFVGVVIVNFNLDMISEVTLNKAGLGEIGEIYLVNQEGYAITPLRFKDDTFLKFKVDTDNTRNCLTAFEGLKEGEVKLHEENTIDQRSGYDVFGEYAGYGGEMTIGSNHIAHEINWCLIAEISKKESLGTQRKEIINSFLVSLIILIIFIGIIGFFVAKLIVDPLKNLQKGIEIIERGDLDHKVGTDAKDETGKLSRAFDKMTEAIKQSRFDIDKQVKEQTDKIKKQQIETEKAKREAEEMNDAMTGREMRMIELKNRIKELEKNKK